MRRCAARPLPRYDAQRTAAHSAPPPRAMSSNINWPLVAPPNGFRVLDGIRVDSVGDYRWMVI
eukprot:IDg19052t1